MLRLIIINKFDYEPKQLIKVDGVSDVPKLKIFHFDFSFHQKITQCIIKNHNIHFHLL